MSGRKADNKDKMEKDEKKGKTCKKGKGSKGSKGSKSSRSKAKKPKQTTIKLQRSPDDLGHPGSYVKALHIVRSFLSRLYILLSIDFPIGACLLYTQSR